MKKSGLAFNFKFISYAHLCIQFIMIGDKAIQCAKNCLNAKTAFRLILQNKDKIVFDKNIPFLFHYYDSQIYTHHKPVERHETNDPLLPPYPPFREVIHLQEKKANHYVFINILMVALGHVVISSANPRSFQGEPLNISDCSALSQVIQGFNNEGIAYYNCGVNSGCSQMHKHVQFVPYTNNPLFSAMTKNCIKSEVLLNEKFNFQNYSFPLKNYSPHEILNGYNQLLEKSKWKGDYNFLVTNNKAILIPRKCANHPIYDVNISSLDLAGHFFIWENDNKNILKEPLKIIHDVGIDW